MFCWRLHNDQQHLASSVAPDFRSSSSSIIVVRVPVVVVVVEIAATTIMTCTEQNLSQILLDNNEVCRILLTGDFLNARQPQSIPELFNWESEVSVWVSAKAWDTTGNGSLNDLKCCISIVQTRSYKNVSLKTHQLSSNFTRGFFFFFLRAWQDRHMSKHSRPPVMLLSLKGHYIATDHITARITWGCSAGLDSNFAWKFSLRRGSKR